LPSQGPLHIPSKGRAAVAPNANDPGIIEIVMTGRIVEKSTTISYVRGDVVEPPVGGIRMVAFLTNDVTPNWGGGVARQIAIRKPDIQNEFRARAKAHPETLGLGKAIFLKSAPTLYYAALIAQHGLGKSPEPKIRYDALDLALRKLGLRARDIGASVHLPRIGAGSAGGRWEIIEPMVEERLGAVVPVYVYDLPGRSRDKSESS
jgi:O-acetyl-ADP-ribose deacetylase (regulator of RNase III)